MTEKTVTVTEEDLKKSLAALEGKKPEEKTDPPPKPTVVTPKPGTVAERLAKNASEGLKKALDVSDTLAEITNLLGAHVDETLEAMAKSIQASAERGLAIITVLENFKKSLDANTEALKKFGEAPAGGPKTVPQPGKGAARVEVLRKNAAGGGEPAGGDEPQISRRQVLDVLETLAKSAKPGTTEQKRWIDASVKFESTKQIANADLIVVKQQIDKQAA